MSTTESKLFTYEAAFRDHLVDQLWNAGILAITERSVSRNAEHNSAMRTDILIGRYSQPGCEVTIECKTGTDSQSLCTGLGQALIYRRAFGADKAVVCFPRDVKVPSIFLEVCEEHGVMVASDETIVEIVDPDQSLRGSGSFEAVRAFIQDIRQRLRKERFDQWPEDALRSLLSALKPLVDIYDALPELPHQPR